MIVQTHLSKTKQLIDIIEIDWVLLSTVWEITITTTDGKMCQSYI